METYANSENAVSGQVINELSRQILSLFRTDSTREDLIEKIVLLVQNKTQFESVGVRLQSGFDFPYYFTNGFDSDFVEKENSLCNTDAAGEVIRDSDGNPVLECMCGNIIMGRTDPSLPFFTQGGSFWSNCTTKLLASTDEKDRQSRTRNRCNGEGYESVALMPIREGDTVHGLLQLTDRRKNCFTLELIEFLEGVAVNIALLFSMQSARKQLQLQADDVVKQASVRVQLLQRIAKNLSSQAQQQEFAQPQKHLIKTLQKIIEEMDTLSGILPICSSCKKIRTDSGYWEQIESYISKCSDTNFTHTYCPSCYEQIMNELQNED